MQDLVEAHRQLDDPMAAAIWIKRTEPFAWLVEVLPELPDDEKASQPFVFTPSAAFRYALHLIAGNFDSLVRAIQSHRDLAVEIAGGEVLFESADNGARLVQVAREAANGAR
ncbi:MAG: hypothetical protein IT372_02400 [Polyangiaceae bacterium]|nr:hypothetical protein [Polyangiaceae bacterium]